MVTMALAFMAVTAAQAAAASRFESSFEGPSLSGLQSTTNFLTFGTSGHLECTEAAFIGMTAGKIQESIVLHPVYAGCSLPPLGSATVSTTGCNYQFHAATGGDRMGTMDILCEGTSKISIATSSCTFLLPSQTNLHGVSYQNEAGHFSISTTLANVTYEKKKPEGQTCFLISGAATYTGDITVRAFKETLSSEEVEYHWVE
ncbi:MAG TPA: hypothetical protein VF731_11265 [Solirubrobacterales bacterium]